MSENGKIKFQGSENKEQLQQPIEFTSLGLPESTASLNIKTSKTLAPQTNSMSLPKENIPGTEEKLEILIAALRRNPNFEYEGPPIENLSSIDLTTVLNKIKFYEKQKGKTFSTKI